MKFNGAYFWAGASIAGWVLLATNVHTIATLKGRVESLTQAHASLERANHPLTQQMGRCGISEFNREGE